MVIDDKYTQIVSDLRDKYPAIEFGYDWYNRLSIVVYRPTFYNEVRISKSFRPIHLGRELPNLRSFYLTENHARSAIGAYVTQATAKFETCLEALQNLQESLGFKVDHDAYAVDDSGLELWKTIDFEMGGFNFSFILPS